MATQRLHRVRNDEGCDFLVRELLVIFMAAFLKCADKSIVLPVARSVVERQFSECISRMLSLLANIVADAI